MLQLYYVILRFWEQFYLVLLTCPNIFNSYNMFCCTVVQCTPVIIQLAYVVVTCSIDYGHYIMCTCIYLLHGNLLLSDDQPFVTRRTVQWKKRMQPRYLFIAACSVCKYLCVVSVFWFFHMVQVFVHVRIVETSVYVIFYTM